MVNPVFLYIPNLIGYTRVLFCALSFYYAFSDPNISVLFYFLGQGADGIDGVAARYFNQCSEFGAVLDMITDRMGTTVLLLVLSHQFPSMWGAFAFLIVLDITAHWFQMYSRLITGAKTHKDGNNFLIKFYYSFPILFICCCGNELFFMSLYLLGSGFHQPLIDVGGQSIGLWKLLCYVLSPIFAFKNFMNIVQFIDSASTIAALNAPGAKSKSK